MADAASGRTDPSASWKGNKAKRVNPRYRNGAEREPTGKGEGSRSNAQDRGAGGNLSLDAWGTEAQGTHDKSRKAAGRQCRGMASVPGKGRRDIEPDNCLNETGVDCAKLRGEEFALGRAATAMSPVVS
jgi:hypothetical protein